MRQKRVFGLRWKICNENLTSMPRVYTMISGYSELNGDFSDMSHIDLKVEAHLHKKLQWKMNNLNSAASDVHTANFRANGHASCRCRITRKGFHGPCLKRRSAKDFSGRHLCSWGWGMALLHQLEKILSTGDAPRQNSKSENRHLADGRATRGTLVGLQAPSVGRPPWSEELSN